MSRQGLKEQAQEFLFQDLKDQCAEVYKDTGTADKAAILAGIAD